MAICQLFCSTGPPRERDSLYSWLVCVCATMTWVGSLGALFSFGIFLPVFMDYFNTSRETTGEYIQMVHILSPELISFIKNFLLNGTNVLGRTNRWDKKADFFRLNI